MNGLWDNMYFGLRLIAKVLELAVGNQLAKAIWSKKVYVLSAATIHHPRRP